MQYIDPFRIKLGYFRCIHGMSYSETVPTQMQSDVLVLIVASSCFYEMKLNVQSYST